MAIAILKGFDTLWIRIQNPQTYRKATPGKDSTGLERSGYWELWDIILNSRGKTQQKNELINEIKTEYLDKNLASKSLEQMDY